MNSWLLFAGNASYTAFSIAQMHPLLITIPCMSFPAFCLFWSQMGYKEKSFLGMTRGDSLCVLCSVLPEVVWLSYKHFM